MREDYQKFVDRGVAVIAMGPDGPNAFRTYWEQEKIPYIGLSDKKSQVADRYHQEVNIFKLGRMPALFVIDKSGMIRYQHYGDSAKDIPSNAEIFQILDELK